ncbi:MAG: type 4a pilus biogenesis protein PilO [Elusimicrobiaceae bacterium]
MADEQLPQSKKPVSPELIKIMAAVILFCGVVGYFYWSFLWRPYSIRLGEAEEKIEKINMDMAKALGTAKRLEGLKAEIEALQAREAAAEKQLPKSKDIPGLIKALVRDARNSRIFISEIVPRNTTARTYYTETYYDIRGEGSYRDVGLFLAAVASSTRIFNVKDLSLSPATGGLVNFNFTLVAFAYKG